MPAIDIKIELIGFDTLPRKVSILNQELLGSQLQREMINVFTVGMQKARNASPIRTGFLRSSINTNRIAQTSMEMFAGADYAAAVNETHPTKAHYFDQGSEYILDRIPVILSEHIRRTVNLASRK